MNKLTGYFIVCALLFGAQAFAVESGMNPTGEAFVKAVNAGDVEGVVALYSDDSIVFPPDAMMVKGKAAVREIWTGLFAKYKCNIQLDGSFHETRENLSFSWGNFVMTMTPKEGGEPMKMEGRYSDVSKKINGKWQYVVDHASVPVPMPPATPPKQ